MDSNRLRFIDRDLSATEVEAVTTVSGYTVVKAPKGPTTPVRINAQSAAKIQDIFGLPSTEYPELYEALLFNNEYDTYISAPYFNAKVPVAYITPSGIYESANLADYTPGLEKYLNGEVLDLPAGLNGITSFGSSIGATRVIASSADIAYISKLSKPGTSDYINALIIPTGIKFENFSSLDDVSVRLKGLFTEINEKNYIDLKITAEVETIDESSETPEVQYKSGIYEGEHLVGYLCKRPVKNPRNIYVAYDENGQTVTYSNTGSTTSGMEYLDEVYAIIFGDQATESASDFSSEYVKTRLDDVIERKDLRCCVIESINKDDIRGIILPKYPSERKLTISFSSFNAHENYRADKAASRNILKISACEEGAFHNETLPVTFSGSLDDSAKDAIIGSLGFNKSNAGYADQNLVAIISIKPFTDNNELKNTDMVGYGSVILENGERQVDYSAAELKTLLNLTDDELAALGDEGKKDVSDTLLHNKGWEEAKDEELSNVNIFFDVMRHFKASASTDSYSAGASQNTFFTVKKHHPLAGYIFNYTIAPAAIEEAAPLSYGENYWNICNELLVEYTSGSKFMSSMVGGRAAMQARIIESRYGGVAPMYINSGTPSVGGQLDMYTPTRLRYRYTKDEQSLLDNLNYNPVVKDSAYNLVVVGQKTCKAGDLTDWSYIGHASSFLELKREIREVAMVPQLGKANNPYYRELRKTQVEQLLAKRISGNDRIWAAATVDTSDAEGINDLAAQRQKIFRICVYVKVDVFSETVELVLTNVDQSAELA